MKLALVDIKFGKDEIIALSDFDNFRVKLRNELNLKNLKI
jgi:hypothetical protein